MTSAKLYNNQVFLSWRSIFLRNLQFHPTQSDIYAFGVCSGKSVREYTSLIPDNVYNKIYGFDSFMGLPKDDTEPLWQECWAEGNFDSQKETNSNSPIEASKKIEDYVDNKKYIPIIGFYEDSLKDALVSSLDLKPALIVDIDVDLYSSTITTLDFMLRNKLITRGTLLFYDDWGGSKGFETFSSGESRAHKEMFEKYDKTAREIFVIGTEFPQVQKVFLVE